MSLIKNIMKIFAFNLILVSFLFTADIEARTCDSIHRTSNKDFIQSLNEKLQDKDYKVLVLARHGKASQENKFTSFERAADSSKVDLDLQRPLAKKGKHSAKQLSKLIEKLDFRKVGMWGSYAERVQNTARPIKEILGKKVKVFEFERDLYYADVAAEMESRLVSEMGENLPHAFFWGHGKSTLELFKRLTGTETGFLPTAGMLIIVLKAKTWSEVFDNQASEVEAYAWSPNNSHTIEGSDVNVFNLINKRK